MAASAICLVVLRVTETFGRGSVFCSTTSCFVEGLLWSLPGYAAMLGVVVSAALIAAALMRGRVGPLAVRSVTLIAAVAGAIGYVVAAVATLDFAWAGAFSGELGDRPTALLPATLMTFVPSLWTLSLMLTGVAIALTSLLLLPLRAPLPLIVLGWATGVALAAIVPLATSWRAYLASAQTLSAVLLALAVWAFALTIVIRRSSTARVP
jgi:hypothetical protein